MAAGCQHELWKVLSVILIYIPSDSDHKVCRLLIAQVAYIVTLGNSSESGPLEPPGCVGSRDFSKGGSKSSFRREWTYDVEKQYVAPDCASGLSSVPSSACESCCSHAHLPGQDPEGPISDLAFTSEL